jgi:hypothetical protein
MESKENDDDSTSKKAKVEGLFRRVVMKVDIYLKSCWFAKHVNDLTLEN